MMRASKRRCMISHAKRRARERYGMEVTTEQLGVFLERASNRLSTWCLIYGELSLAVVYDNTRKMLVTFLPPRILTRYFWEIHRYTTRKAS